MPTQPSIYLSSCQLDPPWPRATPTSPATHDQQPAPPGCTPAGAGGGLGLPPGGEDRSSSPAEPRRWTAERPQPGLKHPASSCARARNAWRTTLPRDVVGPLHRYFFASAAPPASRRTSRRSASVDNAVGVLPRRQEVKAARPAGRRRAARGVEEAAATYWRAYHHLSPQHVG